MNMLRWIAVLIATLCCSAAAAADAPQYGTPPAWVKPMAIPDIPAIKDGSPVQALLLNSQSRLTPETDDFFVETAMRILTPQGLASVANLPFSWSPDTETLTIHRMSILRDGKTIDLLAGGKNVTVLRRESRLELAMLDGRLTATVQPEGVQVGDVIDIAISLQRHDPVMQGRSQALSAMRFAGVAGHTYLRAFWPDGRPIAWRATEGMPKPKLSHADGVTELVIDEKNQMAPKGPADAPPRFSDVGELELSQFATWADVSALMTPLYVKASSLTPDSPVRAEAAKIRAATPDPKKRAEAALRLVEERVHYVFLGMNLGGYVPADADLTWTRRFGDCKGKTALLLALLHEVGVEAEPALVSTADGDALSQRLPMMLFDHVFVRAVIGGKVYWLDGTRSEDRDLDDIPVPDFRWVLPVQAAGAKLERVEPKLLTAPSFESVKQIDASAGYDAPAKAHLEQTFRGDSAIAWRLALNALGEKDAERRLREYWRGQAPWVDARAVTSAYDEEHHVMRLVAEGEGKLDWTQNEDVRDFDIGDSSLGFNQSFKREPGPYADAPFVVPYPEFNRWTVTIALPSKGAGFRLLGPGDVDETVAGRHYLRTSRLEGGEVTMTAEMRTLASEFPFAEAEAAGAELRKLASRDVFVRGLGGSATAPPPADDGALGMRPVTAADFSSQGMSYLVRRDYDHAIEDFSAAARLAPTDPKNLYNRGVARYSKRDDAGALADFNEALRLNPKDSLAYAARAELMIAKGDSRHALADLDVAIDLAPANTTLVQRRYQVHDKIGAFADALKDLDILLAAAPAARRATLLNARCWARAELGQNLSVALADCDAALALAPTSAPALDSRGFVELRMGQYDKAIADYDAALSQAPKQAV
jgi:tetratricopeptide (TPR) repeat protein